MACRCHIHVLSLGDKSRFRKVNALNKSTGTDGSDLDITRKKANHIRFSIICKKAMTNF